MMIMRILSAKHILMSVLLLLGVCRLAAQEDHIHFNVVNDTARIDAVIEEDSLGNLINSMYDSNLDNVDHGNGLLFTYFNWMPGFNLYQNFDIVTIHYRHQGSAPRDTIDLTGYYHPAKYRITSNYGYRHRRMHRGVDLGYPEGTPVAAAWDGIVRISKGTANTGGYGNLVVIRHDNGLETYYGHLSRRLVNPGQMVKAGDIIGLGGNTGRSYGSHLHFEVRYLGNDINPCRLIDFDNFKTKFDTLYISGYTVSVPNPTQQVVQPAKPKPQTSAQYYKVRKGDNLGRIAAKYHTTVSKIKKLNHLRSDFIREGQRLRVR
jgi:murein DD-endopeptidase MepM/ murein hydrolase activator NlpD